MEGSQQTQSQGASKQAMIYICGGKNSSLNSDNEAHAIERPNNLQPKVTWK